MSPMRWTSNEDGLPMCDDALEETLRIMAVILAPATTTVPAASAQKYRSGSTGRDAFNDDVVGSNSRRTDKNVRRCDEAVDARLGKAKRT